MKGFLKILISIILVLVLASLITLYFKKPKKPEIIDIGTQTEEGSTQLFESIQFQPVKPPTSSKPLIPYEEATTPSGFLTSSTSTTQSPSSETSTILNEGLVSSNEINIIAKDFEFIPKEIKVKAGTSVLLRFKNESSVPFDLKISGEDYKVKIDLVPPGQESKIEIEFPKPGVYEFFTTVPIGVEKNMRGKIIVE